MKFIKFYSDLQINPKDLTIYKKLIKYYESNNPVISVAYKKLLEEKIGFNSSSADKK